MSVELFGTRNDFVVGVRLTPVSSVSTYSIDAVRVLGSNASAEQNFEVDFTVNGMTRTLRMSFADELLEASTITGATKQRVTAPL